MPERRYYTGMMMALAAITMFFAAFTSAYIVRKGLSDDWRTLSLPFLMWPNTFILLASSLTLEKARRCLSEPDKFRRWWWATTLLGIGFVFGQLLVWSQLRAGGVYVHTNPSSSFFYVLTGAHAVHLFGGIVALLYLSTRMWRASWFTPGATTVGVTALYWHFMDGLWIYLLLLILLWR